MSKPEPTRIETVYRASEKLTDKISRIQAALKNPGVTVADVALIEQAIEEFEDKIDRINPA